jgi:hypothetical protein
LQEIARTLGYKQELKPWTLQNYLC